MSFWPLLITLVLLIVLLRFKLGLGWALFISSTVLALLSGMGTNKTFFLYITTGTSKFFLELVGVLYLIALLEVLMRKSGSFDRAMESFNYLLTDRRYITAIFPALLGLLPSVGGARFSAPMVETAGHGLKMSGEDKALFNYWFRHVWEFVSPLFPGLIMTASLLQVNLGRIILALSPFTLLAIFLGYLFYIRPLPVPQQQMEAEDQGDRGKVGARGQNETRQAWKKLLLSLWPILFIVGTLACFELYIVYALLLGIIGLFLVNRWGVQRLPGFLQGAFIPKLFWMSYGVTLFKTTIEQIGITNNLPALISAFGIPDFFVVMIIPFLIGGLTGLTQGYVGTAFPLLLPFLAQGGSVNYGFIALAYVTGFAGVMLTPMYFCLILSIEYFKANLAVVWVRLFIPEVIMVACAVIMAVL